MEVLTLDDDVGAVHRSHPVAHHGHVRVEGGQQPEQDLGDAPAAEDRDPAALKVRARGSVPTGGAPERRKAAQPGESERQRQLSNGLRVDTLRTGPEPLVVNDVDVGLDARPRQLDPLEVRRLLEHLGERGGLRGAAPHQGLRFGQGGDHASARGDRFCHPRGR